MAVGWAGNLRRMRRQSSFARLDSRGRLSPHVHLGGCLYLRFEFFDLNSLMLILRLLLQMFDEEQIGEVAGVSEYIVLFVGGD